MQEEVVNFYSCFVCLQINSWQLFQLSGFTHSCLRCNGYFEIRYFLSRFLYFFFTLAIVMCHLFLGDKDCLYSLSFLLFISQFRMRDRGKIWQIFLTRWLDQVIQISAYLTFFDRDALTKWSVVIKLMWCLILYILSNSMSGFDCYSDNHYW